MGDVVKSKFCVIYAKLGSVHYPIACGTDASVETDAEALERAPATSQDWREYVYGRKGGRITGSGLTKINTAPDNLYTVFDLQGFQWGSQKLMVKYSLEDDAGNVKVLECRVLVERVSHSKANGKIAAHSYELLMDGMPKISSTPVANTNPQILVYEITLGGSETSITLPFGDNAEILLVEIDGDGSVPVIIAPEGYGPGEVQYDPATKILTFGDGAQEAGTYVRILYVDVDSVSNIPAGARSIGDGGYRTIGDGNYRTTA